MSTRRVRDNCGRLWHYVRFSRKLLDRRQHVVNLAFAPDGRTLAVLVYVYDPDGWRVLLWDTVRGKLFQTIGDDKIKSTYRTVFSPDGRLLACVLCSFRHPRDREFPPFNKSNPNNEGDKEIAVWELASGKEIFHTPKVKGPLRGPRSGSIAFSLDGRLLVDMSSKQQGKEVQLWDARTGTALPCPFKYPRERRSPEKIVLSPNGKQLATSELDGVFLWDVSNFQRPAAKLPALNATELDRLWSDLASDDIKVARRAVWSLADRPQQCVPLLRDRLQPVAPASDQQIAASIANLDNSIFAQRQIAESELERLGERAAPALRKALAGKPSAEARKSLRRLLGKIGWPVRSTQKLRVLRALEILEHVGNDEAQKVLRKMAGGVPEAVETREAKASLRRLELRAARK